MVEAANAVMASPRIGNVESVNEQRLADEHLSCRGAGRGVGTMVVIELALNEAAEKLTDKVPNKLNLADDLDNAGRGRPFIVCPTVREFSCKRKRLFQKVRNTWNHGVYALACSLDRWLESYSLPTRGMTSLLRKKGAGATMDNKQLFASHTHNARFKKSEYEDMKSA